MIGAKQNQIVNVNELMDQMSDGIVAISRLDAVEQHLTRMIIHNRNEFLKKRDTQNKEYYDFYYPFQILDAELQYIADLIGYQPNSELETAIEEDLKYAMEWNKAHSEEG